MLLSISLDFTSCPDGMINDNINLKTIISALISRQHRPNHMYDLDLVPGCELRGKRPGGCAG